MSIRAVIFDLDGTITDTIPLTIHSLREVTRELTGKILDDNEILKEFGPIDTEIIRNLVDNENKDKSVELYVNHFTENFDEFIKPIDKIEELLKSIRTAGLKTGLFTGRGLRMTNVILKKLDLYKYFDEVITGDMTSKPKPDPEGILKILEKFDVKSNEGIYVGDFDVDILASRAAGTISILALWSSMASKKLIDLKPDYFFESPDEFISLLKERGAL